MACYPSATAWFMARLKMMDLAENKWHIELGRLRSVFTYAMTAQLKMILKEMTWIDFALLLLLRDSHDWKWLAWLKDNTLDFPFAWLCIHYPSKFLASDLSRLDWYGLGTWCNDGLSVLYSQSTPVPYMIHTITSKHLLTEWLKLKLIKALLSILVLNERSKYLCQELVNGGYVHDM